MSEDLDDDDDLAMADAWRDYQADLLRPTGVDDPDAVAEAIWQGDLVLKPAADLAELVAARDRLASLLQEAEAEIARLSAVPEGVPQEGVVVLNGQRYTLTIASMPAIWDEAIRDYLPAHPIPVALVSLSDTPHEEGEQP